MPQEPHPKKDNQSRTAPGKQDELKRNQTTNRPEDSARMSNKSHQEQGQSRDRTEQKSTQRPDGRNS